MKKVGVIFLLLFCIKSYAQDWFFTTYLDEYSKKFGLTKRKGNKKIQWAIKPAYDMPGYARLAGNWENPGDETPIEIFGFYNWKGGGLLTVIDKNTGNCKLMLEGLLDSVLFGKRIMAVKQGGRWGVYNAYTESWAMPPLYDEVVPAETNFFSLPPAVFVRQKNKWGMYNLAAKDWMIAPGLYKNFYLGAYDVQADSAGQKLSFFSTKEKYQTPAFKEESFGGYPYKYVASEETGSLQLWRNDQVSGQKKLLLQNNHWQLRYELSDRETYYFSTDSLGKKKLWAVNSSSATPMALSDVEFDKIERKAGNNDKLVCTIGEQERIFDNVFGWERKMMIGKNEIDMVLPLSIAMVAGHEGTAVRYGDTVMLYAPCLKLKPGYDFGTAIVLNKQEEQLTINKFRGKVLYPSGFTDNAPMVPSALTTEKGVVGIPKGKKVKILAIGDLNKDQYKRASDYISKVFTVYTEAIAIGRYWFWGWYEREGKLFLIPCAQIQVVEE